MAPRPACLIAIGASLAATVVAAPPGAAIADPTRPPTFAAAPAASTVARAASGPRAAASRPAAVAPPLVQALFLSRSGAASALVDDQLVRPGDRLGDRIVVAIDAQGLVTRGVNATATDRLWLLGASTKQPAGSITLSRSTTYLPGPQPAIGSSARAATDDAPAPSAGAAANTLPGLAVAEKGKP